MTMSSTSTISERTVTRVLPPLFTFSLSICNNRGEIYYSKQTGDKSRHTRHFYGPLGHTQFCHIRQCDEEGEGGRRRGEGEDRDPGPL